MSAIASRTREAGLEPLSLIRDGPLPCSGFAGRDALGELLVAIDESTAGTRSSQPPSGGNPLSDGAGSEAVAGGVGEAVGGGGAAAAFAAAAPAQAGIYTVYACNAAGRQWDNRSWELVSPVNSISADQDCAGDNNIGLNQAPGGRTFR